MTHTNQLSKELGVNKESSQMQFSCDKCQDAKFVRVNLPVDHSEFGKAIPCDCASNESDEQAVAKLQAFSRINAFEDISFSSIKYVVSA